MGDYVPESALNYDEIFQRGGRNLGDEDFDLFKCPNCGHIYLIEYEVDTVYLDATDLSQRAPVYNSSFPCVSCGQEVPEDEPWIGPKASPRFQVTWDELEASDWIWAVYPKSSTDS